MRIAGNAPVPGVRLIAIPIAEARTIKWARGRQKDGAEFIGDPLEELFDELLDALNYVEEAHGQGLMNSETCSFFSERLNVLAEATKLLAGERHAD